MVPVSKPRVFLDSNVVISGLYSPEGAPGIILEHFVRSNINVVVSTQVLEEIIRTIKEKLPGTLPALKRLLVNMPPEVVIDPELPAIEPWRKWLQIGDASILAAVISAGPDYFVTGDEHFLDNREIAKHAGLNVVTPAQLLEIWEKDDSGGAGKPH